MKEDNNHLKIVSYNIHKGFSRFRKLKIHSIKESIYSWEPDIIFLQEVQGQHDFHAKKEMWPQDSQYDFLGDKQYPFRQYGPNKFYGHGHHGNAILSKYPIVESKNFDISTSHLEKRGALLCKIDKGDVLLHVLCVHLSLLNKDRERQYNEILKIIDKENKDNEPFIIAGDFNDWSNKAKKYFVDILGFDDVLSKYNGGKIMKSFPSEFPLLALDRVYSKNIETLNASIIKDCGKLSDHVPVKAEFSIKK